MEGILLGMVLVLVSLIAINWILTDANKEWKKENRELQEKNKTSTNEIIRLQHELRKQELRADELASKLYYETEDIECYNCSNQGCGNGCRYTVGAKGCKDMRREEENKFEQATETSSRQDV